MINFGEVKYLKNNAKANIKYQNTNLIPFSFKRGVSLPAS